MTPLRGLRAAFWLSPMWAALVATGACGGPTAGPGGTSPGATGPGASGAAGAAAKAEAAAPPVALHLVRKPGVIEVTGRAPDGVPSDAQREALRAVDKTYVTLGPAAGGTKGGAAATQVIDAGLLLIQGTIDTAGKRLEVAGTVRTPEDQAAVTGALKAAAAALDLAVEGAVEVDKVYLDPGVGFVKFTDGSSTASLALTDVVSGKAAKLDSLGRVPVAVYGIAGGDRTIGVAAGKTTWLRPDYGTGASILVSGKHVPLDVGVKVVLPGEPGALDFVATYAATKSMPAVYGYGTRYFKAGEPVKPGMSLDRRDFLHQIVLHTDLADDSASAFNASVKRELSDHFLIDWDGTIYQGLDVELCGYHAGEANYASIGIVLNNRMENLEQTPKALPYPKKHPRLAEMMSPAFERKPGRAMTINYGKVRSFGYTEAQYRSLGTLVRALAAVFPKIGAGVPRDAKGAIGLTVLEDPSRFDGIMGHWHWEAQRWDPGPSFDWTRTGVDQKPE